MSTYRCEAGYILGLGQPFVSHKKKKKQKKKENILMNPVVIPCPLSALSYTHTYRGILTFDLPSGACLHVKAEVPVDLFNFRPPSKYSPMTSHIYRVDGNKLWTIYARRHSPNGLETL
jgi:hypothetical protein